MSEVKEHVRETAKILGIEIEDSRLDSLVEAWKQAMEETKEIRQQPNPHPTATAFDPTWSEKR